METEQIDKRVTWLDEQRRKNSEEIGRLVERLDGLEQNVHRLADQLQVLAGDLSRTSALASRIGKVDETISNHRLEIGALIETSEQRRIAREKQLESIRKTDQSQTAEALDEIRAALKGLKELRESLDARRQEEIRMSRALDGANKSVGVLTKEIEERSRNLVGLQESRRQDALRISELESRAIEQYKKSESLLGLIETDEDQLRRLQTQATEMETSEGELRQAQTLWTEQQTVRLAEFERHWKIWEKRFEVFSKQADGVDERFVAFDETQRNMKKLEAELGEVVSRLERRIEEISEIQRLSEDRFKQEWSGFQADGQKRWTSFKLEAEEQRRDHARLHQKLADELQAMQEDLSETMRTLDQVESSSQQRLNEMLAMVREWAAEAEQEGKQA